MAISVCKLLGELIVLPFVDRVGRRPMLLGSSIGLSVGLGCMALAYADAWPAEYGVLLLGYGPTTRPLAVHSTQMPCVIYTRPAFSG